MNKWVCITKDFRHFTYGKIYEGELSGSLFDFKDDTGEKSMPCLFGSVLEEKSHTRYGPKRHIQYFLSLEEWREKQINDIINE